MQNQFRQHQVQHLYIHIPFCSRICSYCDFCALACSDSLSERQSPIGKLIPAYLVALEAEILTLSAAFKKYYPQQLAPLKSLYLGGGTPSLLQTQELVRLIAIAKQAFGFAENCEVTLEVNPEHAKHLDWLALKAAGLNRVSVGVQTSDANLLRFLQRQHQAFDIENLISILQKVGINNYSCDLILALPGQNWQAVQRDLDFVLALSPSHLSLYSLILEPGSKMYQQYRQKDGLATLPTLPDENEERELVHLSTAYLKERGFCHYEISNFARNAHYQSVHNTAVWASAPYFGVGISAGSYVLGVRRTNTRQIRYYLKKWLNLKDEQALKYAKAKAPIALETAQVNLDFNYQALDLKSQLKDFSQTNDRLLFKTAQAQTVNSVAAAMEDYVAFGIRDLSGINSQAFQAYFGVAMPATLVKILEQACEKGLLVRQLFNKGMSTTYALSSLGLDFMDQVSRKIIGCLSDEI